MLHWRLRAVSHRCLSSREAAQNAAASWGFCTQRGRAGNRDPRVKKSQLPTVTNASPGQGQSTALAETLVSPSSFVTLQSAFPGIDLRNNHFGSFVAQVPSSAVHQQPQIATVLHTALSPSLVQSALKHDPSNTSSIGSTGVKATKQRANHSQQHVLQSSAPILTSIAFPGNPLQAHSNQQQQNNHHQQQQQQQQQQNTSAHIVQTTSGHNIGQHALLMPLTAAATSRSSGIFTSTISSTTGSSTTSSTSSISTNNNANSDNSSNANHHSGGDTLDSVSNNNNNHHHHHHSHHHSNSSNGTWPCPACKITFKSASELQSHLTAHTKAEKSVPCQQCGKLFASAERVRIHIRVAHGEKSCACQICGSGFSYRCKLMDHMRTHTGDKPFRCEQCGRSFSQKNHLRRHQMIHTGERPYPCEVCGRGFYRKDKLNRHRKIHMNSASGSTTRGSKNQNSTPNTSSNSHSTSNSTVTSTQQQATPPSHQSTQQQQQNQSTIQSQQQQQLIAASVAQGQGGTINLMIPVHVPIRNGPPSLTPQQWQMLNAIGASTSVQVPSSSSSNTPATTGN